MKRIIRIFLIALCLVPTLAQAGIIAPANIRFVEGDVMFRTPADDEWLPVAINTPLDEGDELWCSGGSRVEMQLADGTMVRMNGGSRLDLLAIEDGFTHLHLASGRLYLRTSQTSGNSSLQIDADNTTVVPAARTRLRIDMLLDSQEDVALFKGTAYVEGNGSRTRVRAGEHIALEEGHSELLPLNPADSWELWNLERDRAQSRSARTDSYLPEELRGHGAELDVNGTWVRVSEYGMVWRPTVIHTNDWAPYRSGRWIWKGDDYVWIAEENWGWVPYHYGRWAVVSGIGWCWVPPDRGDVYWGPGYVGWYTAGSQVGWTPLAPGETFYGRRNYGRHSEIITNVNINTTTIVYRNQQKPGGLTVVRHDDFLRGRTVIQQPSRNASISVAVSVGSPRIKPLRETRMPIVRQTSPGFAPPRSEQRDNRELRDRFPRVIPAPGAERRRQQPAAVTSGAVPQRGAQPSRVEQPSRRAAPVITPSVRQQPETPEHEGSRQRPAPQAVPPAAPAVPPGLPQRGEQSRRGAVPVVTPPAKVPPRAVRPPRELKQKKVWKVTTPENSGDKDNKEKEHKDKERK